MLIDARSLPADPSLSYDVCVVGAGPAGITLALELMGRGLRICLVESGDELPDPSRQALAEGENGDHSYYRLQQTRVFAYGGTSNHWMDTSGMRARPLDDLDFSARPEVGRGGWPFGRAELDDDYRRAQEICGLGPFEYDLGAWVDDSAPALPLGEDFESVMFQLAPLGMFQATRPTLAAADDVTVLLHATALKLQTDASGQRVDAVDVGIAPGWTAQVRARHVVLAAGGLENPRMLMLSRERHADGIGNAHGQVGRNFMEHPHIRTGVIHPCDEALFHRLDLYGWRDRDGFSTTGMLKLRDDVLVREGLLSVAFYLHPSTSELVTPAGRALVDLRELRTFRRITPFTARRAGTVISHPIQAAQAVLAARGRRHHPDVVQLVAMAEQSPANGSRVMLSDTNTDAFGRPQVRLDWRFTQQDHHSIRTAQEVLDRSLRAEDLGHVEQMLGEENPPTHIGGGYHHMGTTRMGNDPMTSVVDAGGTVHGMANLHVTGTSVFPTAGYANPTLTVVALAVRLAGRLRDALGA